MNSIDIFPWNDNFNTGIALIDEQHRKLADLINLLASHVAFNANIPALNVIFDELAEYAVYHFDTEEKIWHEYMPEDPFESDHRKVHSSFLTEVLKLKSEESIKPISKVIEELLAFLTRWLAAHILESDRSMAMVVTAMQSGMPLEAAKKHAAEQMRGATKVLINIILSIYESLSTNTLHLMRELAEQKRMTMLLDDQDRHFEILLSTTPVGIFETDINGKCSYVNAQWSKITGLSIENAKGDGWVKALHPEDKDKIFAEWSASTAENRPFHLEYRFLHPNGKTIWVLGQSAIYKSQLNDQSGYVGTITDITERKQVESAFKIAATIFESQEGMLVTDANSIILRVNSAFTKITGFSAEDAIGQTPRLLSSGRQSKSFYTAMWESINNNGAWEGEIWNRRKSGEVYPEYLAITAVKDADGSVTNYVATLTDITMSKAASEEIKSLAFYDPLTQLPNRRLLLDRMSQALAASARSGQRGALLFMDLDHFKTLNDTLGHDVGDILLQQVAARLTASVREGDTISRLGGDEFVVILEDLSEDKIEAAAQTKDVAEKILLALNQPYQLKAQTHHSTPSIGATLFNGHEQTSEELLKQADIAMYQSKTEGRNTLRFFDPKMQEEIAKRAELEQELRKAIEQKQFELHYQIQVGSNGQVIGAEALIRWHHPERGIISPFNFIPLAEESGLILPIGQWVLETACAQLKSWQQNPLTHDLVISINVSAKQFYQVDFVEQVLETAQRHDINPTQLKLELTESLLVENINDIIAKMKVLNQVGIRFSLDDFGTGYSSLQYLKMLPIDQLKIDQSFVRDIVQDTSDKAIVVTIINVAHGLGINVIAEGVETEAQRQFLQDNGCTHYQGYLFGKPVPADMFKAVLSKN